MICRNYVNADHMLVKELGSAKDVIEVPNSSLHDIVDFCKIPNHVGCFSRSPKLMIDMVFGLQ